MKQQTYKAVNECIDDLREQMLECEAMIPITVEAAVEAGIQLRGAEAIYKWFAEVTDHLALMAAKERNKRTNSIMQQFNTRQAE